MEPDDNFPPEDINHLNIFTITTWNPYYGVIYKISDTVNGKVYIGQTIQALKKRFRQHLKDRKNKYLRKAFNQYPYELKFQKHSLTKDTIQTQKGEFKMEAIQKCTNLIELNKAEIKQIKKHALRELMGLVTQESILFHDTVRNNIKLGVDDATDKQITEFSGADTSKYSAFSLKYSECSICISVGSS